MRIRRITRQEVVELCRLTSDQAYKLLKHLCNEGVVEKQSVRKASVYVAR